MNVSRLIVLASTLLFALVGCAIMKAAADVLSGGAPDTSTPDAALGSAVGAAAEGLIRSTPMGSMALDAIIAIGSWKVAETVVTPEGRKRLATLVKPSRGGLKGSARAAVATLVGAPDPYEREEREALIEKLQKELDDKRYGVARPTPAG